MEAQILENQITTEFFRITKKTLPNGRPAEIVAKSPGVRIIIPHENSLWLNYELRNSSNGYVYRLPGGKMFDDWKQYETFLNEIEQAEDSEACFKAKLIEAAIREAEEEQGLIIHPTSIECIDLSRIDSTINAPIYCFVAHSFTHGVQKLQEKEKIEPRLITKKEAKELCLTGKLKDDRSALMLLKYLYRLNN